MEELIKALQIFSKYTDADHPTGCEHNILRIYVSPWDVSTEDKAILKKLGFSQEPEFDCFYSVKYGSA